LHKRRCWHFAGWCRRARRLLDYERVPFGLPSFDLLKQQLDTVEFTGDLSLGMLGEFTVIACAKSFHTLGEHDAKAQGRGEDVRSLPLPAPDLRSA
jgi:hypothetical protein